MVEVVTGYPEQLSQEISELKTEVESASQNDNSIEIDFYAVLENYRNMRALKNPYYKFGTLVDKWNEYERLYRLSAGTYTASPEEQSIADIMFPDFHSKIEAACTRAMNIYFSGAETFNVKVNRKKDAEATGLARLLYSYNISCVENFRQKVRSIFKQGPLFGTWHAYVPYKEEPVLKTLELDYEIDENDEPVKDNAGLIKEKEPYSYDYIETTKKYTDLNYLDSRDVYVNPYISSVQKQRSIFVMCRYTYDDLIEMENDEIIPQGTADYVKENYSTHESVSKEQGVDNKNITKEQDDLSNKKDQLVYEIYVCYYKKGEPIKWYDKLIRMIGIRSRTCIYRAFVMNNKLLDGTIKKTKLKRYPIKKGVYIEDGDNYYGISMADEMYSVFKAKNSMANAAFTQIAYDVKGGGAKDSRIPSFKGLKPGEWINVPGLASWQGKGTISINELRGSSQAAFNIMPMLENGLQKGTGITDFLEGMPTGSGMDDTATGVQIGKAEADARLNDYFEGFETQFYAEYATEIWLNYSENKFLEEAGDIFDEEELSYTDADGVAHPIKLDSIYPDINIEFEGVQRVNAKERRLTGLDRLMSTIAKWGSINPNIGKMFLMQMDEDYFIKQLTESLDVGDPDALFPKEKRNKFIEELMNAAQAGQTENIALKQLIQIAMEKMKEQGDELGLQAFNQAQAELMKAQEQGGGSGVQ